MEIEEVYSLISTHGHCVAGAIPANSDNATTGLLTFKLCNEALFYGHFRRSAQSPQTRTKGEDHALQVLTDAFVAWDDEEVSPSDHERTLNAKERSDIIKASYVHAR